LNPLLDIRANGFNFLNTRVAIRITKLLNLKVIRLLSPIRVKGFDSKGGLLITYSLWANLTINKRKFFNMPFLILDLGNYDIIIGYQFFKKFYILLDLAERKLY
jgi:hypothetical protein